METLRASIHVKQKEMEQFQKHHQFFIQKNKSTPHTMDTETIKELLKIDPNKMERQEMLMILNKICSTEDVRRLLLKIDMQIDSVQPIETLTTLQLKKAVNQIIYRYFHKILGFKFEETEWTMTQKDKQLIWKNSIPRSYVDDEETLTFLNMLVHKIKLLNENLMVKYDFINYDDICQVFLVVEMP